MTKPKGLFLLCIFTVVLLWWQGQQPAWNRHMQVDVWISWQRISYWFTSNYSFVGLTGNEILPATLLYVFAPVLLFASSALNYTIYLPLAMIINFVVVAIHGYFLNDKTVFLTTLIFLGPILLFRFEPMVTLFMLLSFTSFIKGEYKLSGFWIGLATAMKVFPIIFLPYMSLILLKDKKLKPLLGMWLFFAEALLASVIAFLLMRGSIPQILSALAFHSRKLISIESIPGSIITGWSILTKGVPPTLIPGNGIWSVPGPAILFNKLWIIPVIICYFFVWKSKTLLKKFDYKVPYVLILIFLVFSKNLNPQYLWWFLVMLPMIKPSRTVWALSLMTALLNQIVFPLYYTTFVETFFRAHQQYWIYYVLLIRNIGVMIIAYLGVVELFFDKNIKNKLK